ncbi:MAG: histidine kinase, partial [Muribaculaceae bacterium]|nr:histidine kinase [Muribaculaceae bacterium]
MALAGSAASVAQNNVYGIRDDLYRIYANATDNVNRPECLEAADSMYRMARTMSDGKAMCLAQTIPVRYY